MMIEIGIIAVTSLARIQDSTYDLIGVLVLEAKVRCEIMRKEMTEISANMTEATFVITLVMDEFHECDSLDEAKSVVMNLMKDLIKERWPSFEDIEGINKYDQLSVDMDNHILLRTISKISRKDMVITKTSGFQFGSTKNEIFFIKNFSYTLMVYE